MKLKLERILESITKKMGFCPMLYKCSPEYKTMKDECSNDYKSCRKYQRYKPEEKK